MRCAEGGPAMCPAREDISNFTAFSGTSSWALLLSMCSPSALLFLSLSCSFDFLATLRPLALHALAVLMCMCMQPMA